MEECKKYPEAELTLAELETANVNWIDIKKRGYPWDGCKVLITWKTRYGNSVRIATWDAVHECWWGSGDIICEANEAIAWAFMPQPYQEGAGNGAGMD